MRDSRRRQTANFIAPICSELAEKNWSYDNTWLSVPEHDQLETPPIHTLSAHSEASAHHNRDDLVENSLRELHFIQQCFESGLLAENVIFRSVLEVGSKFIVVLAEGLFEVI